MFPSRLVNEIQIGQVERVTRNLLLSNGVNLVSRLTLYSD